MYVGSKVSHAALKQKENPSARGLLETYKNDEADFKDKLVTAQFLCFCVAVKHFPKLNGIN